MTGVEFRLPRPAGVITDAAVVAGLVGKDTKLVMPNNDRVPVNSTAARVDGDFVKITVDVTDPAVLRLLAIIQPPTYSIVSRLDESANELARVVPNPTAPASPHVERLRQQIADRAGDS